jgi:hypothetical protein
MSTFIRSILYIMLFLTACHSRALEDVQKASQAILIDLCQDLHEIQTLDQLIHKAPALKKYMRRLTELMIEADQDHRKHPEAPYKEVSPLTSDMLRYEILRLCEDVEGSRSVLEEIQEEMLDKLDLYERKKKAATFR